MNTEKENHNQEEHKSPAETEKKIHQTHFPVEKNPLHDDSSDSEYEWVRSGTGHWILVKK
jgi:hypothetical protein